MKERNKIFILLIVIAVIAAIYYFAIVDHTPELAFTGVVDSNQVIVNARIAGRIERLAVDEGAEVREGDLIATLDSGELTAQKEAARHTIVSLLSQVNSSRATEEQAKGETSSGVMAAQAQLQSARSQLESARADLLRLKQDDERVRSLADSGVASQQDKDRSVQSVKAQEAKVSSLSDLVHAAEGDLRVAQARTHQAHAAESNVQTAQAQAASAESQLAEIETRLGYTRVMAPLSGTVSLRVARQGEVVNAGGPIVTIVDFRDTWVRAAVPETLATRIGVGDVFKVRLPNGDLIDGKVIVKSAEGDFATQRDVSQKKRDIKTVSLKLKVENPRKALVPGMTAEVLVPRDLALKPAQEAAK